MHNSKDKMSMYKKVLRHCLLVPVILALVASCRNEQTNKGIITTGDSSILIPLNNIPIKTVNMTDENGLKQGTWQEDDKEEGKAVYMITKEYNYKNDTLHGYYLEYKTKSPDTLIYGNYFQGKKHGEWKYWAEEKNEIERIEIYEHGVRVK
jgi:hypothetical protein